MLPQLGGGYLYRTPVHLSPSDSDGHIRFGLRNTSVSDSNTHLRVSYSDISVPDSGTHPSPTWGRIRRGIPPRTRRNCHAGTTYPRIAMWVGFRPTLHIGFLANAIPTAYSLGFLHMGRCPQLGDTSSPKLAEHPIIRFGVGLGCVLSGNIPMWGQLVRTCPFLKTQCVCGSEGSLRAVRGTCLQVGDTFR